MSMLMLAAALISPPSISSEAQALGRQLAEFGTLAAILPAMKAKETGELMSEDPGLDAAERARLQVTADRVYLSGYDRLMTATGNAYASRLTIAEMKELIAFHRTPTARKYQAATPAVIADTMKATGELDFKGDVRRAFCAEARKLCPAK